MDVIKRRPSFLLSREKICGIWGWGVGGRVGGGGWPDKKEKSGMRIVGVEAIEKGGEAGPETEKEPL